MGNHLNCIDLWMHPQANAIQMGAHNICRIKLEMCPKDTDAPTWKTKHKLLMPENLNSNG